MNRTIPPLTGAGLLAGFLGAFICGGAICGMAAAGERFADGRGPALLFAGLTLAASASLPLAAAAITEEA